MFSKFWLDQIKGLTVKLPFFALHRDTCHRWDNLPVQFREHGLTCQTTSAMEEVDSVSTTTFCPGCRVTGGARFLVLRSFFFFRTFVMRAGPRFFFPADHTTKQGLLRINYPNHRNYRNLSTTYCGLVLKSAHVSCRYTLHATQTSRHSDLSDHKVSTGAEAQWDPQTSHRTCIQTVSPCDPTLLQLLLMEAVSDMLAVSSVSQSSKWSPPMFMSDPSVGLPLVTSTVGTTGCRTITECILPTVPWTSACDTATWLVDSEISVHTEEKGYQSLK
jgi:hypothetical protein